MIGMDLIKGAFGKHPHDVYMAYDKLTDELIIRLIDPKRLAYLQCLENNDRFALLVESDSDEVIGVHLFNFVKEHLQTRILSNLRQAWPDVKNLSEGEGYIKFLYDAREKTPRSEIFSQSLTMVQHELCI